MCREYPEDAEGERWRLGRSARIRGTHRGILFGCGAVAEVVVALVVRHPGSLPKLHLCILWTQGDQVPALDPGDLVDQVSLLWTSALYGTVMYVYRAPGLPGAPTVL